MQGSVPELSFFQLLDQPVVKRLGRLASFLALLAFGGVTGYFFSLGNRITAIEQDRATRIIKADANTKTLNAQVSDLSLDMDRVRADVTLVKVDIATVKGILQQMQRENATVVAPVQPEAMPMPLLAVRSN
jgi:hypothetical protein